MKHIKHFENWVTDVTDKNVIVNYGDKKPKLSDAVIDAIQFIEDNYDQIKCGLNATNESGVKFKGVLELDRIKIDIEKRSEDIFIPYIHFSYKDHLNNFSGYRYDITDYDYEYLKDYFYKIYKECRKKDQEKDKEDYKLELKKIEEEKIRKEAGKYNI